MLNEPKSAKVIPISGSTSVRPDLSLARLPAPIHRVREKAEQLFKQTLKNLFDSADDALFDLADKASSNQEQNIYFEAMREVRLKRREIEKSYFITLDEAYAALLKPASTDETGYGEELSLDDLSLVGNDQLEFQVAVESMIAKALERAAESAQHIALRFDSLVPAKVYQQNNPLGPDIICRSFWAVIEPLEIDIKAKLILLKLFDKAVLSQIQKIYTVINNILIQQNILPSMTARPKRKSQSPSTQPASSAGGNYSADSHGSAASGGSYNTEMLTQLRQLMNPGVQGGSVAPGGHPPSDTSVATGAVMNLQQLTQALTSVQHVVQPLPASGQALLDSAQIIKMIQQQAKSDVSLSPVDQDVIHLINMLFEFILDDRNLAPTMKALLSRLQIPMLKIAVEDKAFFNVSGHPARRLLNELATAALGWQEPEEHPPTDLLYKKIVSVVDAVLEGFESDVTIFEGLLTDFIAFIEKEQRRAVVLERRTLDAEDGKAKAEQARERVAEQLQNCIGGRSIPDCVQTIIDGPWHNVLFLQLLKYGGDSEEWASGCDTVKDLIWSVTATMDGQARSRLMSLLPDLLARLKAGFEVIAFNPFEANELLQKLETEHLSQLRQPDQSAEVEEASGVAGEAENLSQEAVDKESSGSISAAEPVVEAEAIVETGDVETGGVSSESEKTLQAAEPEPEPEPELEPEPEVSSSWLEQVDRFSQGSWFEVTEPDKPVYRCRLAAIIPGVQKFIFVNRNGMKVAEKTRIELAQSLESGLFQLLDDSMLFDRALESVIGNLRSARSRRE